MIAPGRKNLTANRGDADIFVILIFRSHLIDHAEGGAGIGQIVQILIDHGGSARLTPAGEKLRILVAFPGKFVANGVHTIHGDVGQHRNQPLVALGGNRRILVVGIGKESNFRIGIAFFRQPFQNLVEESYITVAHGQNAVGGVNLILYIPVRIKRCIDDAVPRAHINDLYAFFQLHDGTSDYSLQRIRIGHVQEIASRELQIIGDLHIGPALSAVSDLVYTVIPGPVPAFGVVDPVRLAAGLLVTVDGSHMSAVKIRNGNSVLLLDDNSIQLRDYRAVLTGHIPPYSDLLQQFIAGILNSPIRKAIKMDSACLY